MNCRATATLAAAAGDLDRLGMALVRAFHTAPFPICSRLARTIRKSLSYGIMWKSLEADTVARADAMLCDVRSLHHAVAGHPGIDPEAAALLLAVGDALLEYRTSLEPAAADAELLPV